MSLPNSLRAYADCQQLYEAAVADPKGARACLGTHDACVGMRTRMHYFRKLDREANAETYPIGDPMHGASAYDDFVIQIMQDEDEEWWLYVTPRSAKILAIEGLSQVPEQIDDNITDVESHEVHVLEGPHNG